MGGFSNRVGVTIEESVLNAMNLGSNVSTRNIGLLMERVRGVANKPTFVSSLKEDKKLFGDVNTNMYSPFVVESIFNNLNGFGINIFGIRIVGAGCVASTIQISNENANVQELTTEEVVAPSATEAQVNNITPSGAFDIGDKFFVTKGATTLTYTATATTVDSIVAGIVAMIVAEKVANPSGDFGDVTASEGAGFVILTADVVDTAFVQTSATENAGATAIFKLTAGRQGSEDVGTWGNDLAVKVFPKGDPNGLATEYLVELYYKGYLVETYKATNWLDIETQINQRSEYVIMEEVSYSVALTSSVFSGNFTGGVYNAPVEADYEPAYNSITGEAKGLALFEAVDVQILACPEIFSLAYVQKAEAFVKSKNKFFAFSMPYLATEATLETYFNGLFNPEQSYVSGFLNWGEVSDGNGNKIWIPAIGYVIGAGFVRKAGIDSGNAWSVPAGLETRSSGFYRFTHEDKTDDNLSRYAKTFLCNSIKFVKNVGYCIWTSRTYSNNPLYMSSHIRLETNWLITNLLDRNEKFNQKLNTPELQKDIKMDNLIWFQNIYNKGGVERSVPFSDAVVIEVTTSKEDRKEVEMDIAWIPPECIEHLHIKLSRNDGILAIQ